MQHVNERAQQVNDVAEEFTLSHAVMALRRIIEEENKESCSSDLRELKKQILNSTPREEASKFEQAKNRLLNINHKRVFIVVDYLVERPNAASRTIMSDGDYIEIVLPGALKGDINGLRKALGHELGHLALHLDDMFANKHYIQGTLDIVDEQKELEAASFAKELSRLRIEHLKKTLCEDCEKA